MDGICPNLFNTQDCKLNYNNLLTSMNNYINNIIIIGAAYVGNMKYRKIFNSGMCPSLRLDDFSIFCNCV